MADPFHVRDLTSADHDQAIAVRTRSFGPLDPAVLDWWTSVQDASIAQRRVLGAFDGDRLVGHAKARPFQQLWGGRAVPMAGIAGVVVAPEYRGRGVASSLLRAVSERAVELGDVVSALYPATVPPYRRAGWEIAGAQTRLTLDPTLLRGLATGEVAVRQGTEDDAALVQKLLAYSYAAGHTNGAKLLTPGEVTEALTDDGSFSFLTEDGFVLYAWDRGDLVVNCLVAPSEASARALWAVVGSGSSTVEKVHAYVAPDDPIHLLLPEEVAHEARHVRWMFRLLDAPAAMAARGFPRAVTGAAALAVEDPMLPSQSGSWVLEVDSGRGALSRSGSDGDALHVGPNGLAAMYAGTPVRALRVAGLAGGGSPGGDELLDAAFAGRAAYLLEYF